MTRTRSLSAAAAALVGVAVLAGCDAERPVGPDPKVDPLRFSSTSVSEPFFVAWTYEPFRTSPIQTLPATSMNAGQYRVYTGFTATPEVLSFASTYPGRLYINGDEPDQGCWAPDYYAGIYHDYVQAILGADPTAKFSPAGLAEPNAYCCPPGDTACYDRMHSTGYAQQFYDAYVARYGVAPRVDEWRLHDFGLAWGDDGNRTYDLNAWKSRVSAAATWAVNHGAPMYLGSWGFLNWYNGLTLTQYLDRVNDAMAWLRNHPNIKGAAWWSYEPIGENPPPHWLKNPDGTLTPEGETYKNGPMSVSISGNFVVTANLECRWNAHAVGGGQGYRYDWVVNGSPWWNTQSIIYRNSGFPFTLSVTAYDKYGVARTNSRTVYISPNNPCWYT